MPSKPKVPGPQVQSLQDTLEPRHFDCGLLRDAVEQAVQNACIRLPPDVERNLELGLKQEKSDLAKEILQQIIDNSQLARNEQIPLCQDTGLQVVYLNVGRSVHFLSDPYEAINEGIRRGYTKGHLRKSVVRHPIDRQNTGDNTPAVIHTRIVEGNKVQITLAPKGAGSENMSRLKMFSPSAGREDIAQYVIETVTQGGGKPCPPLIVGLGIGGNFENCAELAKEALLRPLNDNSPDPIAAEMEDDLLRRILECGVGPMGLGGRTSAIGVKVNVAPCHIASLPVAVNLQCHAARHASIIL
ncbi:fumarate hydratase [Candidatus Haliotispira prima]|uniref:Fumarate hydratase n=1 Tax=Candidatus Haliotispira prima TaxID=3034016 RepID=A0ABY8MDZ8_9SPIO|nr:fumarate hydratase [Candidatus Haliotispira prima]